MVRWYIDIVPCRECEHGPFTPSFARCGKEHRVVFVDGCSDCGKLVNYDWYYNDKKCPDFEQRYFSDPSGS